MRGVTHAAAGLVVGVALREATGDPTFWLPAAGMLGGLLPDIDEPNSTVAHLPLAVSIVTGLLEAVTVALATLVKSVLGHRGAMHSLTLAVGVAVGATMGALTLDAIAEANWAFRVPALVGPAMGVGYITHLITDAMTKTGVPLLWPLSSERIRLLPKGLSAKTGGVIDWLVMFLCYAATFGLILNGMG